MKTTCDWTVERLPWWVNGSLEEAEAERVAAHLGECAACREELAATRGALALYSLHLPIETLLDLVEDEAAETYRAADGGMLSRQVVHDHLGHCPACREELALLRESRATVEADPAAPGATVSAFAPRPAAPAAPARRRLDRRSLALAASILLFAIAAGGWLASGWTAERRGERIAELERRLNQVTATPAAGEPSAEPPATDEMPDETAAALAAAAEREAERAAEIAALEAEIDRLRAAADGGERVAQAVGVGPTETWRVQPAVTRGEERPAESAVEVAAGAEQLSLFLTDLPDEPLRLVVEDAVGRRLLVKDDLETFASPHLGRHLTLTLSLADLPAGELRLRLFAGGEEVGDRLLRVAR